MCGVQFASIDLTSGWLEDLKASCCASALSSTKLSSFAVSLRWASAISTDRESAEVWEERGKLSDWADWADWVGNRLGRVGRPGDWTD